MVKIHIVANDSPLSEESCLTALCGISISRAVRVWTVLGDLRCSDVSTLGSCPECREKLSALPKNRIWLCGAADTSAEKENEAEVWSISMYGRAVGYSPVTRRHG